MKNIFISSTFIDMQAERDMVQERVVPALRAKARKYGDNVGVIDLRWGVDTSSLETVEGATKILQVCLDEIDRSHPYMLIFLGERYGTVMPENLIAESIHGREDKYTTVDYLKSVTALEVEYGALSEKYGELENCVVCFREPVSHLLDEHHKLLYSEKLESSKEKLHALKQQITEALGGTGRLITYTASWDGQEGELKDFEADGKPLEQVLTDCFLEIFRKDWKENEEISWQEQEQLEFLALAERKLKSYVGRKELLEEYYQYALNDTPGLIIRGNSGSGKTALLCKIAERLQKNGKNVFVFFSRMTSFSAIADNLVKQMLYYVENIIGVEEHYIQTVDVKEIRKNQELFSSHYVNYLNRLEELCAEIPTGEKIYFCIDSIDELRRDEHLEKLDFFLKSENVKIIATCSEEFVLPKETTTSRQVVQISELSREDVKTVIQSILASYSRNTYAAIEQEMLKKKSIVNPRYISLLIRRLNMMDASELQKAMKEEEIIAQGTEIVRNMPDDEEDAVVAVIQNGIQKLGNSAELQEVIHYLAVSLSGLRMWDLNAIFAMQNQELPVLEFTLLMKYLDNLFYIDNVGKINFAYKSIRQGLLKSLKNRVTLEKMMLDYVKTLDLDNAIRYSDGMYYARICGDEAFAKGIIRQAYHLKEKNLVRVIRNETVKDREEFFCRLIESETGEQSPICDFFQWRLLPLLGSAKEEMQTRLEILQALLEYRERSYEKFQSYDCLIDLSDCYGKLGWYFRNEGQIKESLPYYDKQIECDEMMCARYPEDKETIRNLSISCNRMGNALLESEDFERARPYFERALSLKKELYERVGSDEVLGEIAVCNRNMGKVLKKLKRTQDAIKYYQDGMITNEELYQRRGDIQDLIGVCLSCNNICQMLSEEDALPYYLKEIWAREELYKCNPNEKNLRHLNIQYNNYGVVLCTLKKRKDALEYFEKSLQKAKELYRKYHTFENKTDLMYQYMTFAKVLFDESILQESLENGKQGLKMHIELLQQNVSEMDKEYFPKHTKIFHEILMAQDNVEEEDKKLYEEACVLLETI